VTRRVGHYAAHCWVFYLSRTHAVNAPATLCAAVCVSALPQLAFSLLQHRTFLPCHGACTFCTLLCWRTAGRLTDILVAGIMAGVTLAKPTWRYFYLPFMVALDGFALCLVRGNVVIPCTHSTALRHASASGADMRAAARTGAGCCVPSLATLRWMPPCDSALTAGTRRRAWRFANADSPAAARRRCAPPARRTNYVAFRW